MLYKLNPLDVKLDFDDRIYKLGETIDVDVELIPKSDVVVREARVDLVCGQLFSRSDTAVIMGYTGSGSIQGGNAHTTTDRIPARSQVNQRTESYVHSSVAFLKDSTLHSDSPNAHRVRMRIEPVPPKRFSATIDGGGVWSFIWRLKISVDVVRGRNIGKSYQVRIGLPQLPSTNDIAAKPRMSTPKKPTGPAENRMPWWSQGRGTAVPKEFDERRE